MLLMMSREDLRVCLMIGLQILWCVGLRCQLIDLLPKLLCGVQFVSSLPLLERSLLITTLQISVA